MSAFAPMNVMGGQDQKRQLIQRLMDQHEQLAARATGIAGLASTPATAAASLPNSRPFGGSNHFTAPLPNLAQSLISRLGPGGVGHPIAGRETSPGYGSPVNLPTVANPHAGGILGGPFPPSGPVSGPPAASSAPSAPPAASASNNATPTAVTDPNAPVAIGNGLFYHPATGFVTGFQSATSAIPMRAV